MQSVHSARLSCKCVGNVQVVMVSLLTKRRIMQSMNNHFALAHNGFLFHSIRKMPGTITGFY